MGRGVGVGGGGGVRGTGLNYDHVVTPIFSLSNWWRPALTEVVQTWQSMTKQKDKILRHSSGDPKATICIVILNSLPPPSLYESSLFSSLWADITSAAKSNNPSPFVWYFIAPKGNWKKKTKKQNKTKNKEKNKKRKKEMKREKFKFC